MIRLALFASGVFAAYAPVLLAAEPTAASPPAPAEKREVLSVHETVAVLDGVAFRLCRGLTTLCPKECGHSGEFATFTIKRYLKYETPGKFADEKQPSFLIQVSDFNKKPQGEPALLATIGKLKPGDFVRLSWRQEYVTKDGNSFPERPVTKLEPLTKEQAAELLGAK
ncbi:MAG: hypothetical protein SFU86_16065 [Pirellulaceae bacterium]|nr:hypothetical protein [Pirellulaceae bacterium]